MPYNNTGKFRGVFHAQRNVGHRLLHPPAIIMTNVCAFIATHSLSLSLSHIHTFIHI